MSLPVATVLIIVLLAINAFFVACEFALISSRRDRLTTLISQGNRRAATVLHATEELSFQLAAAQLGITVASLILGKVAEPAIAHVLEIPLAQFNLSEAVIHTIGFVIALTIITFLHILLGEMVPKNIALAGPEATGLALVPALIVFEKVSRPFLNLLNAIARLSLRMIGVEQKDELESSVNAGELSSMIAESRSEGLLDAEEHARLKKALQADSTAIENIAVSLDAMTTVPLGLTLGQLKETVATTGFSRFPVRGKRGFIGYIHVKDFLKRLAHSPNDEEPISRTDVRPLITLSATLPIDDALRRLRFERAHMGQVVKEGRIIGVVFMEDLIEEYVGTVRDWTHSER
ncbi:MAG: hemolysin family protein [Corynebacterium sp.]|nr:hemolysin family protein [Corynebacterium sp.]